jgi:tRNA-2-methylthio-N6-dimethylallyladenosine synthase
MPEKYFIKTFGCQQNTADSERIATAYEARGFVVADSLEDTDVLVLNTCVIRDRAEEKVYGLVRSLRMREEREKRSPKKIVVTGCLIGAAAREPSGKMMKRLTSRIPDAEFLPIEDVGFEFEPKRFPGKLASIPISSGCNNYCAFCIVPYSRGKEVSRPFVDIVREAEVAVSGGRDEIFLLGQNVNSYGADFLAEKIREGEEYELSDGVKVKPIIVKHLNRHRIPTLFPHLLEHVARIPGVKKITFMSSNPWDFSDELIDVIARNENIDRSLHLPIQAGSDAVIRRMNRWYTRDEYLALIIRIRVKVPDVRFTTDIIVGFPGETLEDFADTIDIVRRVVFEKAYIAWYSPRPGTSATKTMPDDVSIEEKQRRYRELDDIVLELAGRVNLSKRYEK